MYTGETGHQDRLPRESVAGNVQKGGRDPMGPGDWRNPAFEEGDALMHVIARVRTAVVATLLLALSTLPAAAEGGAGVAVSDPGVIDVDWFALTQTGTFALRLKDRFNKDMAVSVRVRNFNFLHYTIEYNVEEETVESYVTLEKLFSQVFGLTDLVSRFAVAPCSSFGECLTDWRFKIVLAGIALDKELAKYAGVGTGLSPEQVSEIQTFAKGLKSQRESVLNARARTLDHQPESQAEVSWFETIDAKHDKLLAKIAAFQSSANLIENGQVKFIGKKKAGTIVTVNLIPKDLQQASTGQPVSVEYFVHSSLPVRFHVGYAGSGLSDVDFATVRTLAGRDLFSQVKNEDGTAEFSAFLTYELYSWTWIEKDFGLGLTLGTDFKDPGDRIYVGASLRLFERFVLSAGGASAVVAEGENPVLDELGGLLQARELFTTITSTRDWQLFIGVSFGVF
jgi:hypothetical protein